MSQTKVFVMLLVQAAPEVKLSYNHNKCADISGGPQLLHISKPPPPQSQWMFHFVPGFRAFSPHPSSLCHLCTDVIIRLLLTIVALT